jgi:microsomal dipeptidase-like Zn-dependent dipeptidase
LKKSLQISQTETGKKLLYKEQLHKAQVQLTEKQKILQQTLEVKDQEIKVLQDRLNLVEKFVGLDKLSDSDLEFMERLYYQGLDMVKNVHFQKKYVKEIESLKSIIDKSSKTQENHIKPSEKDQPSVLKGAILQISN